MTGLKKIVKAYNNLVESRPANKRYYHLKSVYNFITHFEEISDRDSKERVLELLTSYLDHVTNTPIDSNHDAQKIFYLYIYPAGIIYRKFCNFKYFITPQSIFVYQIIANAIILFITRDIVVIFFINALIAVIMLYMYLKSRTTKVFTINW